MIINVTGADGLSTALKTAQAGDTIQLASGEYGDVKLYNFKFSGEVTITSADPNNEAVLKSLAIGGVQNLTVKNLEIAMPNGGVGAYVDNSSNIRLEGLEVHGTEDGKYTLSDGEGIMLRAVNNVVVANNDLHDLNTGVTHRDTTNVTITGNNLHDIKMDGVRGGGSSNIVITKNTFTDFHPEAWDHADGVQFWTTNTTTSVSNITISDNVFVRGEGKPIQTIFMGNENNLPYKNVTISGNVLVGSQYHGITVSTAENVTVTNNFVQGYSDLKAWIGLSGVTNAVVKDNTATDLWFKNVTNLVQDANSVVKQVALGDTSTMVAWQKTHGSSVVLPPANPSPPTQPGPPAQPAPPAQQPADPDLIATHSGTSGADRVMGSSKADVIDGKAGADTMSGAAGDDIYVVDNVSDRVIEANNGGVDTVFSSASTHTLSYQVENLTLTGKAAQTGVGNELNNVLRANSVASTLDGGAGNDVLINNAGIDMMTGGAGRDVFDFNRLPAGTSTITDFTKGQDVLDLQDLLARYTGSDPVADGWVKFQSDSSGLTVLVDTDGAQGSNGFVSVVKLAGVSSLGSSDWLF